MDTLYKNTVGIREIYSYILYSVYSYMVHGLDEIFEWLTGIGKIFVYTIIFFIVYSST